MAPGSRLEDEAGEEVLLPASSAPMSPTRDRGFISMDSPVGRALLGKEVDDEVVVRRPKGTTTFTVLEIAYCAEAADGEGGAGGGATSVEG